MKIGMFKGKDIESMTREELLDLADYAGKEITRLLNDRKLREYIDLDLEVLLGSDEGNAWRKGWPKKQPVKQCEALKAILVLVSIGIFLLGCLFYSFITTLK